MKKLIVILMTLVLVGAFSCARAQRAIPDRDLEEEPMERTEYSQYIEEASKTHGVPVPLIVAVIETESTFNPRAKSHAGAKGLMQLMEKTAKHLGVKDVYDPRDNIMGGTKYLKELLTMFDGDAARALAGYNAGPSFAKRMSSPHKFGYSVKVLGKCRKYTSRF